MYFSKNKNLIILTLFFLNFFIPAFASETDEKISLYIKQIINDKVAIQCYSGFKCNLEHLTKLYDQADYQPIWNKNGKISNNSKDFLNFLKKSDEEGLNPNHYNINLISELIQNIEKKSSPEDLALLDITLSSSFLNISSHLISGRINPKAVYNSWSLKNISSDTGLLLADTLLSERNINEILEGFISRDPSYLKLKHYLKKYREISQNGGWLKFGDSLRLERGVSNKKVEVLRNILYKTGDYSGKNLMSPLFDHDLEVALKNFQKRHGLEPDGKVGRQTTQALNVSVEERIKQIELNMESWRWLPRELGERYLIINIANFELEVFEKGKKIIQMKTIVGKPYRMTPVFSSEINQIVLNPSWYVPRSIAVNDILPDVKNNIGTISRKKLKVYARDKNGFKEINPNEADWSQLNNRNFNYYFVQPPGDFNALGRIKFNLPNDFDVYLHGTSQKNLFLRSKRDFSSGCVRLENPLELVFYLLQDDKNWTRARIEKTIEKGNTAYINLTHNLPVHFLYWTAWVDENKYINFRDDIYNREEIMEKILQDYSKHDKKNSEFSISLNREGYRAK